MLLTHTSFFCSPIKFSSQGSQKTKLSISANYDTKFLGSISSSNTNEKMSINNNGYFSIPCRKIHHPLESELPLMEESDGNDGGVGIVKFFQGKNIFITGATGLVGKVFVEKLLRSTSIGKIFVLIKAKDKEAAMDRLVKEIIHSDLFKNLKEKHGNCYESFVREKLIAVAGNIYEPDLGMDSNYAQAIMKEVDVIVESAASTTLNDRYDLLLDANVNAPQRLMRFAKTCNNLKLFVHISTAYVNGRREGLILEKPLIMGENGRKEDDHNIEINGSTGRLDLADEISLAMKSCLISSSSKDVDVTKDLKRLGLERANFYGFYNAYHLTKALGEMVINEMKGDLPVLIIRPTVIESTYNDPFPGWIQGNRMFDPVILSYGKGQLPAYLADPQEYVDIIPVDMVVNSTIAAIAKHGNVEKPQLNVYHVASGVVNPLKFSEFFDYIYEHFKSEPLLNPGNGYNKIEYFKDVDDFSKYVREEIWKRNGMNRNGVVNGTINETMVKKQCKAKVAYVEQLCKMYEFIGFFKGRFHTGNIQRLIQEMSKEEKVMFEVDARNIDWRKYFMEIHIPGLRRHVLHAMHH